MKIPESQPSSSSKPIHIRRLEQALNVRPFLNTFLNTEQSSDSDSSDDNNYSEAIENLFKEEPHSAKDYYNFENISSSRKWLANVLSENIDTGPEDAPYKCLLKMHAYQKKLRTNKVVSKKSSITVNMHCNILCTKCISLNLHLFKVLDILYIYIVFLSLGQFGDTTPWLGLRSSCSANIFCY